MFPSTFNRDHKSTFTIFKEQYWSECSVNVLDLLRKRGPAAAIEKIELLDETYRYDLARYDQAPTPVGESGIEVVIRKRSPEEIAARARVRQVRQPIAEVRLLVNQYRDDQGTLRSANAAKPPSTNDSEV